MTFLMFRSRWRGCVMGSDKFLLKFLRIILLIAGICTASSFLTLVIVETYRMMRLILQL